MLRTMSWSDNRLATMQTAAESAAAEMRLISSILRAKADALGSRSKNEEQVGRDLRLLANRLDGSAICLVAEASVRAPRRVRWAAKLATTAAAAVGSFAGGAGSHVMNAVLAENESQQVLHHCASAQAHLTIVLDVVTAIESEPDTDSDRAILEDAVARLSSYLSTPHELGDLSEISDESLLDGSLVFANSVRDHAEEAFERQTETGVESDVAQAFVTIQHLAGHLYGPGDDFDADEQ